MARPRIPPSRLLLELCPIAIALLWVAGVARFRGYELTGKEWAVVAAGGFVLHLLVRRATPKRPLAALPAGTTPATIAALAAALLAVLAVAVGGIFEWVVEPIRPSAVSWGLRTSWHAGCVFGACYCAFLARLQTAPRAKG
ncbi:MAG: hypothetical protein WAT39_17750 [Planctomycetota bacterium]